MKWQELEKLIQERTKAIWLIEPDDLVRLRNGVVDSGAGSCGQCFTTLLFAQSETRGLAYYASTAVLNLAEDSSFTLEHLKKMARAHFIHRAGFLDYVGLHEFGDLYRKYFAALDNVSDREAFIRLTRAMKMYGVRLHLWTEHIFPWGVGAHLTQKTVAEAKTILEQASRPPWTSVQYLAKS